MSRAPPPSVLELQTEQLLERVTRSSTARREALRATAAEQARVIVRAARAEARARVRAAIAEERDRLERGRRQLAARVRLEAQRHARERTRALLARMWQELDAVLAARWQNAVQRAQWSEAALAAASALLPERAWRIEIASSLADAERSALERLARARGCPAVEWVCDPTIPAGLRVRSDGVCLDATIAGLLAARGEIEGAFLAEYEAMPVGGSTRVA
ncbi:MAG TPA: hypothetical protein VMU67_13385 [Steroidobacteraceae bacterium]|nr:hypothetical protein [Steroidobacteraceae bacterium]